MAWQQWRGSNFDWIHSRDAAGVPDSLIKVLAGPFDTEADPKDHRKTSGMNPSAAQFRSAESAEQAGIKTALPDCSRSLGGRFLLYWNGRPAQHTLVGRVWGAFLLIYWNVILLHRFSFFP